MAKVKLVLIVAVFVGVVGYLIYSGLQETTVYYHTVDEVLAGNLHQGTHGLRVSGLVQAGSVTRSRDELSMSFTLEGKSADSALRVDYRGVIPDNFKEGMAVVVEGNLNKGKQAFDASVILLKCPSKYEKQVKS